MVRPLIPLKAPPVTTVASEAVSAEIQAPLRSARTRLAAAAENGPPTRDTATPGGSRPPRASLAQLPTELLLRMKLDPETMQRVSKPMHDVFHPQAVVQGFLKSVPSLPNLQHVDRALHRLNRSLPAHLQHEPLAALCRNLHQVRPQDAVEAFHLLANASQECLHGFDPLVELSRVVQDWHEPMRTTALDRIGSFTGGPLARTVAAMDDVIDLRQDLPVALERIAGHPPEEQAIALGGLARHLFALPFLGTHDFARIGAEHFALPWPPEAAAGLLRRIGYIPDEALAALRERAGVDGSR